MLLAAAMRGAGSQCKWMFRSVSNLRRCFAGVLWCVQGADVVGGCYTVPWPAAAVFLRNAVCVNSQSLPLCLRATAPHSAQPAAARGRSSTADSASTRATAAGTGLPTFTLGRRQGLYKASWQGGRVATVRCCWVLQGRGGLGDRPSWLHCGCCCCLLGHTWGWQHAL